MSWIGSMEAAPIASERVSEQNDNSPFTAVLTPSAYLPLIMGDYCFSVYGESYGSLSVEDWAPAEHPTEQHGDLKLSLRGWVPTNEYLGLIDTGGSDPKAPQLAGVFDQPHAPVFVAAYRVNNWNWGCNCPGDPIEDVPVSLSDLAITPGEIVRTPTSGYDIGGGYSATVIYAAPTRLTLKYTRTDGVWPGYSIHLENVCVAPDLLALFRTLDAAGRHQLPALKSRQPIGRALGNSIGVAIRDGGSFLDPRWRYDWWRDY